MYGMSIYHTSYNTKLSTMFIVYLYMTATVHNFIQCLLCTFTYQLQYTTLYKVYCVHVHVSYGTQLPIMFIVYMLATFLLCLLCSC